MSAPASLDALRRQRRSLSRRLSALLDASVAESLAALREGTPAEAHRPGAGSTHRIGITGAPGAGKSSLIASLAAHRLGRDRRLGVLAVDPSSPVSQGSILGDRIRMDAVTTDPRFFLRSVPSRNTHDGLCANVPDLLLAMEAHGFDDLIVETVGVGQAEYGIRPLVDTLVLVLMPHSGDAIQAMKAGILEMADIYVVNKADLPGAKLAAAEIRAITQRRAPRPGEWVPPVVLTSQQGGGGIDELDAAIDRHGAWAATHRDPEAIAHARRRYHVQSLIGRRVNEVLDSLDMDGESGAGTPEGLYARLTRALADPSAFSADAARPESQRRAGEGC